MGCACACDLKPAGGNSMRFDSGSGHQTVLMSKPREVQWLWTVNARIYQRSDDQQTDEHASFPLRAVLRNRRTGGGRHAVM